MAASVSAEGVQALRRATKTDPDPRVRRRAQAVLLVAEGQTRAQVARLYHTAAHRVRAWQDRFAQEGRHGLVDRPRGGRPSKLSAADRAWLEEALERGPQAYAWPTPVWSVRDLQALLTRERGGQVDVCTLHRVLQALGYRYRRPRHDLTHRQDAEAVAAAQRVLDWLQKKRLLSANDPIGSDPIGSDPIGSDPAHRERPHRVYVDECEIHTHPYLAKVWRRKGRPMKIPAAGEDHKCTIVGAVDYASGQVIRQTSPRTGEEAFAAFLDHLAQALPASARAPAVVVLDHAGYHKSHALRAQWQRLSDWFQPFFLPAYAPQLDLIERLWRYVKQQLACHRWWNDLDRLLQATEDLLAHLEVHFHSTDGPAFRPVQNFRYPA